MNNDLFELLLARVNPGIKINNFKFLLIINFHYPIHQVI